jgi:inosose dehydratase
MKLTAGAGVAMSLWGTKRLLGEAIRSDQRHIATNTYPWLTFARREDQEFELHTDALLADIATTGISGYEPIITDVTELQGLAARLQSHGLKMQSIYVNSTLHDEALAEQSIAKVIQIAKAARDAGTDIVVTNPAPLRWGGPEDKDDRQLRQQAKTLDHLGAELRKLGVTLAYHNHDAELRQGGREFHHMLTATDPEHVKLCLDAHWVFRGCGDSEVAVFDALMHYHPRIVELHLRQSVAGVWTEDFRMTGDIDYVRLFEFLEAREVVPHLVLEQAVEEKSPHQLLVVEAHRRSRHNLASFV